MTAMRVLMIDAGPDPASTTAVALAEIQRQLQVDHVESERVYVGGQSFLRCRFCGACGSSSRCALDDGLNALLEKAEAADAYVFASQSHYGVADGGLTLLIHRFVTADHTCAGKPVALVVTCRRSGATSALAELTSFFAMKSMPIVSSSYWNVLVGNTPELARQDKEGLRTMRNLARNLSWLIKSIQAGRSLDLCFPSLE